MVLDGGASSEQAQTVAKELHSGTERAREGGGVGLMPMITCWPPEGPTTPRPSLCQIVTVESDKSKEQ